MRMYYLESPAADRNLFVRAANQQSAIKLWRQQLHLDRFAYPGRIDMVPDQTEGEARAFPWGSITAWHRRKPLGVGRCPDCKHHGADCHCHKKTGGWIKYEPWK